MLLEKWPHRHHRDPSRLLILLNWKEGLLADHGRDPAPKHSDILRHVFEAVVRACMDAGLVKGEGFAVDASVM
jgi:hypothetical protein